MAALYPKEASRVVHHALGHDRLEGGVDILCNVKLRLAHDLELVYLSSLTAPIASRTARNASESTTSSGALLTEA